MNMPLVLSIRLFYGSVLLTLVMLFSGCEEKQSDTAQTGTDQIIKSPNDQRDYRYVLLDNGLKVVLISDPKADKSAAAMAVFRGSSDEPEARPGLAHFLEHMLFIGTEKYPEADGYFSFVQAHGGNSNAYTGFDHTNYFFDIQPEYFKEGLDRFAQFFISPLLDAAYVEREKNAVHSEYQMQIKEDSWRGFQVQKLAANPDHAFSRFNIGALETLDGEIHKDLVDFFEEAYSANQMALVVLSNESLDGMLPWISKLFSTISNQNLEASASSIPLVKTAQLPSTLRYQTLKSERTVSYTFPLGSLRQYYRIKPLGYLSNLLGHEGEGSLHKLLTGKGWITGLGAYDREIDPANSVMSVDIGLTPEGALHIPEVNGYLFAYLDLLRQAKIEKWLYDEQAVVAALGFRFKSQSQAMDTVTSIAPVLQYYPVSDLLIAPYLMEQFDGKLISALLSQLTSDNVIVSISGPDIQGEQTEKWFGVPYDLNVGPIDMVLASVSGLSLPRPNPFLPEAVDLVSADDKGPATVVSEKELEIFLDTDIEFGVPRAVMNISLRNQGGLIVLEDVVQALLYSKLVQDDLNALAYPALLAGLGYQIASPPKGFRITISGYHDKQMVLLDEVLQRLVNLDIDSERFNVIKAEILKDLTNSSKDRPFQQGYSRLRDELLASSWRAEQMIESLQGISIESLLVWRDGVLSQISAQVMVNGNVLEQRATHIQALLTHHLKLAQVEAVNPLVREISGIEEIDLDVDHNDAAMVLYLQDDHENLASRARSALLVHLIRPAYFTSLRTEQQLGYVVSAMNPVLRERGAVGFVIQSPVAPVHELKKRTLTFLQQQVKKLEEMESQEFQENKMGLISVLLEKDKNLSARAQRYWSNLDRGIVSFDAAKQLAEQVDGLDQRDMIEFVKVTLSKLTDNYFMVFSQGKFAE
jgi:secreted Zn-dependent insulinase-like peptidase